MKSKPLTLHKDNYFPAQWDFLVNKKMLELKHMLVDLVQVRHLAFYKKHLLI